MPRQTVGGRGVMALVAVIVLCPGIEGEESDENEALSTPKSGLPIMDGFSPDSSTEPALPLRQQYHVIQGA